MALLKGREISMSEADCKELAKVLTFKQYDANVKIADLGQKIDEYGVILSGLVSVTVKNPEIK